MKRTRIDEILVGEGLRWRNQETWFGERVDPDFAAKRGPSTRSTQPPAAVSSSASTRWAQKRPRASRAQRLVGRPSSRAGRGAPAGDRLRAPRQRLHLRRVPPATGEAFTAHYPGAHDRQLGRLPGRVEAWLPRGGAGLRDPGQPQRPPGSRCAALLLAHPRWEFVFQPTYAAYLNLIEPWWKVLRSLALKGRRFETWEGISQRSSGNGLLEHPSASVRLGATPTPSGATHPRHRATTISCLNLADAPLSASFLKSYTRKCA